jgi:S-adenosylmethionine hydrolase
MEAPPLITLTTDFGYKDPFAGIMKGVIFSINPAVQIVDITHDIRPQNVLEAAFVIEMSHRSFPRNTIHVVVVDPGVGSVRRALVIATDNHYFVGPDNGVFSRIYKMSESLQVVNVTAEHYFLPRRSSTFHGRDVFAPLAAWLSRGINISKFGDFISDYVTLPMPVPMRPTANILEGEVVYIDRFGNSMTNIDAQKMDDLAGGNTGDKIKIMVKSMEAPFKRYYSEGEDKKLCSLINSFGYIELFVNGGNASRDFGINVGEKIGVVLS